MMKTCVFCGRQFENPRKNTKYCCAECERRARYEKRKDQIIERNEKSTSENLRKEVAIRFKYKCALCGWHIPRCAGGGCEVHHIKEVCNGGSNEINNLILLCPNCHKMVHKGLILDKTLKSKVSKIEVTAKEQNALLFKEYKKAFSKTGLNK